MVSLQPNRIIILISLIATGSSLACRARAESITPGFLQLFMPPGGATLQVQNVGTFSLHGLAIGASAQPNDDLATALIDMFTVAADALGAYQAQVADEAFLASGDHPVSGGILGLNTSALFDVFLTVNGGLFTQALIPQPDQLPLSTGHMTLHQETSAGGTFDMVLNMFADLVFVEVGNPADVISQPLPMFQLTATHVPWVYSSADFFGSYPTGGISLPQGISFTSSEPFFSGLQLLPANTPAPAPIPEPATVLLLAIATLLLPGIHRSGIR